MPTALRNRTVFPAAFFAAKLAPPRDHLTVVVKGTFSFAGEVARPLDADLQTPLGGDRFAAAGASAALVAPTDFAPCKPRIDLLVAPSAFAGEARRRRDEQSLRLGDFEIVRDAKRGRGFGPVSPREAERTAKLGTYDAAWLAGRWPWLPEDFDPAYYQAAPRDQQIEGALRGDEVLVADGLAPERVATRLPGLRLRAFARKAAGAAAELVEVPMRLDTVWVDLDRAQLVLTWRGHTEVRSRRYEEVVEVVVASEDLASDPLPAEVHCRVDDTTARDRAELEAEEDEALARAEAPSDEQDDAAALAEARETLAQGGAPPVLLAKLAAATTLDAFLAILRGEGPTPDAAAAERAHDDALRAGAAVVQGAGADAADLEPVPETQALPRQAVRIDRDEVVRRHAEGESLEGADLSGLDLSELDLTGAVLAGARLDGASLRAIVLDEADLAGASLHGASLAGASLVSAVLARADLSGADLSGADLGEAVLAGADLRGTTLARASLVKTDLTEADLTDADLAHADASAALFDGARAPTTRFAGATLLAASFRAADLSDADFTEVSAATAAFTGALVDRVRFDRADLREASLGEARGEGVSMLHANVAGLRAAGARLPSLRADAVLAGGSIWTGAALADASFARAVVDRADFTDAALERATLEGALMREAVLSRARLAGACLANVSLFRAVLDGADLANADVSGSQLFESELFEAMTKGARFAGADLGRTKLAEAR